MPSPESSRNYPVCILIGAFTLYTLFSSQITVSFLQYPFIFAILALAYLYYRSLGGAEGASTTSSIAAALSLYSITTIILFYPTINTLFRSDDWLILSLFESIEGFSPDSLKKIALFEMFGDIRFQPLAHLLLFIRYLLFGSSTLPYHLLNMALHVATGLCVLLILNKVTRDLQLSLLGGLIFIALPGQFDTVVWTYHIYIITSTLSVLGAIYLTLEYARTKRRALLIAALLLTLVSMLFYEPAILAPVALLVIIYGLYITGETKMTRGELAKAALAVAVIYAFYIGLTLYGLSLTRAVHFVSFSDMATATNLASAIKVTAANLWEATFIRGIGVNHNVGIDDIVYLMTPPGLYTNFTSLIKIALGVLLIASLKPTKRQLYLIAPLAALALSYIFIIALGRIITNPIAYVPAQPRYQYFPNAMLITAMGILLAKRFGSALTRPILSALLFAILFWNISNTIHANNLVAEAIRLQDYHYYNIKDFLRSNPDSRLLLTFAQKSDWKFSLGTDISFDLLFGERLTKFPSKATHRYDGESFRTNPDYLPGGGGEVLGDFTVEWIFYRRKNTTPANPIRIIGPAGKYPSISITTEGLLRVEMVVSGTRELHTFSQTYPEANADDPGTTHIVHMVVEKDDNVLCLAYNGMLDGRVELDSSYNDWNGDGYGLYGEYFTGSGEPVGIIKLKITPERALYGCKEFARGEIIDPKYQDTGEQKR